MVQILLAALDSDEVNSIDDTVESNQLALLLRSCFYDLATDLQLPEHEGIFQLISSTDSSKPVIMTVPTSVCTVHQMRYDVRTADEVFANWRELVYLPLNEFVDQQNQLRTQDSSTSVQEVLINSGPVSTQTHRILCRTDTSPTYFTTYDDSHVILDSYDSTLESTLQGHKTQCFGSLYPTFELSNTYVPALDPTQFAYFLNKAKVRAFFELKQQENAEAAAEARKQKITIQSRKRRVPTQTEFDKIPKYGRR